MTSDEQISMLKIKIQILSNDIITKADKVSAFQLRAWKRNRIKLIRFLKKFESSI